MRQLGGLVLVSVSCVLLTACAATTDPASDVGGLTAMLNAHGHTDSTAAHYYFQYATAPQALGTGFGRQTPARGPVPANVPGNGQNVSFGESVGGLSPATKYYYRVCGGDGQVKSDACAGTQSFTTPSTPTFSTYSGGDPHGIVPGPYGALWFLDDDSKIGRITTAGTVTEFPLSASYVTNFVNGLAGAFDGAVWFTDSGNNAIGRITTRGQITRYPLPTASAGPGAITSGPDTALWFTEGAANKIGRISLGGQITEYPLPTPKSNPDDITTGPDGALWFSEATGYIGRITTTGSITQYQVQGSPIAIAAGSDKALWFLVDGKIGRLTTDGNATYYPVPYTSHTVASLTAGPDGALWFFDDGSCGSSTCTSHLVRITTGGESTSYAVPGSIALDGIAAGLDGAIWATSIEEGCIPNHPGVCTTPELIRAG